VKKETTKEQILMGARELFHHFGFEKTSMEDIAAKVHKAKRSLYNHFENKEDLFAAAVDSELTKMRQQLMPIFENEDATVLEQLKEYLLRRAELMSKATTYHTFLKKEFLNGKDGRFDAARTASSAFDTWEHQLFVKVWLANPYAEQVEALEKGAEAFADMLQMALYGLNYSFFVQDNYEQYKSNYSFLINLIINSVKNTCIQNPKELLQ